MTNQSKKMAKRHHDSSKTHQHYRHVTHDGLAIFDFHLVEVATRIEARLHKIHFTKHHDHVGHGHDHHEDGHLLIGHAHHTVEEAKAASAVWAEGFWKHANHHHHSAMNH